MKTIDDNPVQISYNSLRKAIGLAGLSLPVVLLLGSAQGHLSISDYYYSNLRDWLEGVLIFLGAFLIAYRPYGQDGWGDNLVTTISGICALLVALFPTINPSLGHAPDQLMLRFIPVAWSAHIHNFSAIGLFVSFAVLSLFYFTRGKTRGQWRKLARNGIYMACGSGILLCIGYIIGISVQAYQFHGQQGLDLLDIFWPESLALCLFGLAWLTKGGWLLPDRRGRHLHT